MKKIMFINDHKCKIWCHSEYEETAINFLNKTKTEFYCRLLSSHVKYFVDDKEKRDVYEITLKNKNHSYTFNFGQSINKSYPNKQFTPNPYGYIGLCYKK